MSVKLFSQNFKENMKKKYNFKTVVKKKFVKDDL